MGILLPIISEFDSKGIDKAVKEFQALEGAGAKAGFALKKAALPAAAAIAGLAAGLGSATKAAMEDAAAQEQLAGVLRRTGMATEDEIKSVEDFITAQSRLTAVTDDQLRPALATLVNATGSATYAQELLTISQDVAAATGKDLETVTQAMAKAANGQTAALYKLDPALRTTVGVGAEFEDVLRGLNIHQGAAAEAAETAAGRMANLQIQFDEAKESIGAALLPVMQKLLDALLPLAYWAQENTRLILIFAGVIGGLSAAVLAVNAAMKIYQATLVIVKVAQAALNFVMAANPIGLVVIAIAALVAAFVVAYKQSETFREIINTLFGAISKGVSFSVDLIKGYLTTVLNFYKTIFNTIANLWNNSIGKLSFKFPSWVPGVGGSGFSVPKIPMLADGGIVNGPTLAMIGERGPEAVIPLDRMQSGGGVTVNVMGGLATSAEIGEAVVNAIRAYTRTAGPAQIQIA
jgi:hypothetical protein